LKKSPGTAASDPSQAFQESKGLMSLKQFYNHTVSSPSNSQIMYVSGYRGDAG